MYPISFRRLFLGAVIAALAAVSSKATVNAFTGVQPLLTVHSYRGMRTSLTAEKNGEETEIVARRITVRGDVNGGYVRTCVLNEAGKFRRLSGTMSPPDDTDLAEIYIEGKKKMVDGFVRWCQRGKIGLSQKMTVENIAEEEPTGLYDDFYVKVKE